MKEFNAIQSFQGGRKNFLIQVPLSMVEELFTFPKEPNLSKTYQRKINENRKAEIANYINGNSNFILPAVVAFPLTGDFTFESIELSRSLTNPNNFGIIQLSADCKFGLFDGQHRISGIIESLKGKDSNNGGDSIPVMLLEKPTLQAAQQIFADINLNAVKPSQSIKLFFNNRDQLSNLTKYVVKNTPLLAELVDFNASNLPKDSPKLFSFSAIYGAVSEMYKTLDSNLSIEDKSQRIIDFWATLTQSFIPFLDVFENKMSSPDLRACSIAPFAVTLQALGNWGAVVMNNRPDDWRDLIPKLFNVSFHKVNREWANRVIIQGKIKKTRTNSILISNVILQNMNIELKGENRSIENAFLGIQGGIL